MIPTRGLDYLLLLPIKLPFIRNHSAKLQKVERRTKQMICFFFRDEVTSAKAKVTKTREKQKKKCNIKRFLSNFFGRFVNNDYLCTRYSPRFLLNLRVSDSWCGGGMVCLYPYGSTRYSLLIGKRHLSEGG